MYMEEMEEKQKNLEIVVAAPLESKEQEKVAQHSIWKFESLCCFWLVASVCSTGTIKWLVKIVNFNFKDMLLLVQLTSITLCSWLYIIFMGIPKTTADVSWAKYFKLIVPLAISIFIRIGIMSRVVWSTPIGDPYCLTVEALLPFFMVILARFILDEKTVHIAYIFMLGIVASAIVMYIDRTTFQQLILVEVASHSALNAFELVFSKKVLKETGLHHVKLILILGGTLTIACLPISAIHFWSCIRWTSCASRLFKFDTICIFILAGLLSWLQTIIAFTLIVRESTLCFIAATACNRICRVCAILGIGTLFLRRSFTLDYAEF